MKAEHCRSIDARRWAREGILQASGRKGGWGWTDPDTGQQLASIGYSVGPGALTLTYTMNGEPMRQCVPILSTVCNYGGARYWFGCPWCRRRVAILYLRNRGFACRKCNRIAYASQSENELGRTWRKQSKIERHLGEGLRKPKGMHHATRNRLVAAIIECEERREAGLAVFMGRHGWMP